LAGGARPFELGLHERRSGVICLGAQEAFCGNKLWEEKHPEVADALWALAASHSQQDPTFRTTLSYTRLTAAEALKQLQELGFGGRSSAIAEHDGGHAQSQRLPAAPGAQSQAPKKIPETDAIFANLHEKDRQSQRGRANQALEHGLQGDREDRRLFPRRERPEGDHQAADHDMGCQEKYTPFGLVDEDEGQLDLAFGSSAKTSDFIMPTPCTTCPSGDTVLPTATFCPAVTPSPGGHRAGRRAGRRRLCLSHGVSLSLSPRPTLRSRGTARSCASGSLRAFGAPAAPHLHVIPSSFQDETNYGMLESVDIDGGIAWPDRGG
jgi:hypothetical protein